MLALVAGLVALFGFGINFGEAVVGRAAPGPMTTVATASVTPTIMARGPAGWPSPARGPYRWNSTSRVATELSPTAGYYRMFLEFQHRGQLRTVEFTALAR